MHICIIHFNLLEKYPPVTNFIRYLSAQGIEVTVISTEPEQSEIRFSHPGIRMERVAKWNSRASRWARMWFYIRFHRKALFLLRALKPDAVLYYETFSAAAPVLYKKWVRPSVPLFIHYHEYMSPEEIAGGIMMVRWQHRLEKLIYPSASLISQTNKERMERFSKDIGNLKEDQKMIVPNFPPAAWQKISQNTSRNPDIRLGFVYVGALSFDTMYAREMIDFVRMHPTDCYWDIYSTNYSQEVISYLDKQKAGNIHFKGGVVYDKLPQVLGKYDVGLILYKGTIPNFVYNAPNKFFEYYVCGLNVWYSHNMKGMHVFDRSQTPVVKRVDFEQLDQESLHNLIRAEQIPGTEFVAEKVFEKWLDTMEKKIALPEHS